MLEASNNTAAPDTVFHQDFCVSLGLAAPFPEALNSQQNNCCMHSDLYPSWSPPESHLFLEWFSEQTWMFSSGYSGHYHIKNAGSHAEHAGTCQPDISG
jgi:hypothetical protein